MGSPGVGGRSGFLGAAVTSRQAWVVGYRGNRPLIERWDGRRWKVQAGAPLGYGALYAVGARGDNDVWAVGVRGKSFYSHEYSWEGEPLIEHWDGRRWATMSIPGERGSQARALRAVAILDERDVWAVGDDGLVARWHGEAWKVVDLPVPRELLGSMLFAVSGTSSNDVWVAGDPGIAHWDGRGWKFVHPNRTGSDRTFTGVTVLSSTDAWAVGSEAAHDPERWWSLILHWDGRRWQSMKHSSGSSAGLPSDSLVSIAAASRSNVFAVGARNENEPNTRPLIERYACA